MKSAALMVLGSMSSVGKSLLVTGLCRLYARRGWRVAPFKAQNMSNNAAVCTGGEIGRAQAVQAFAAGIEPTVDMNPVLLKPEADVRSQIILRGQVWKTLEACDYFSQKELLWGVVTESLDRLRQKYILVILEGAGSPAELNLLDHDLVNLAIARYAQAPCLLVGDIDHGGIFAQLLGTLGLLEETEQDLIKAFVVNKFRGNPYLFHDGIRILEERSRKPVLGVIPYLSDHGIPEEDAASLASEKPAAGDLMDMVVIHFPHISNFDDFDPLRYEPGVHLRFVDNIRQFGSPQVVILPGTKNTLGDLRWLLRSGLAEQIQKLAEKGASVIGFCGGYQMLGSQINNDFHVESETSIVSGLGLLPIHTNVGREKIVMRSQARIITENGFFKTLAGSIVSGYEIHCGHSKSTSPMLEITNQEDQPVSVLDGACSVDGKVWGCHLHGLLENDHLRRAWLESLGVTPRNGSFLHFRDQAYDRLADAMESSLDVPLLDQIIRAGA